MGRNDKHNVVVVPGLINILIDKGIKKDLGFFCFKGAERALECFKQKPLTKKHLTIEINLISPDDILTLYNNITSYYSKYYKAEKDCVGYYRKVGLIKLGLVYKQINPFLSRYFVTSDYVRYVPFRFDNFCPTGTHLLNTIIDWMSKNGDSLMYGASFLNSYNNRASIIMAPPGIGKTYTLHTLANDENIKILSEEASYVDVSLGKPLLRGLPNTLINKEKNTGFTNLIKLHLIPKKSCLYESFGINKIALTGELQNIYMLEGSSRNSITKMKPIISNVRRLVNIQALTYSHFYNPFRLAYCYFNNIDPYETQSQMSSVLDTILKRVNLYEVKALKLDAYAKLIRSVESLH